MSMQIKIYLGIPFIFRLCNKWVDRNIDRFNTEHAGPPDIENAKPSLIHYVEYLHKKLKNQVACLRVEYTGSAFEGVKVSPDIEFDVMMIGTDTHIINIKELSTPGYYHLIYGWIYSICTLFLLSPQTKLNNFFGKLQKAINDHQDMSRLVKLRHHGPAVQMDVYKNETDMHRDENKWYSVDLVFAYEVKQGEQNRIFVAKQLKSDQKAWRISYSLEEKALFNQMDRDKDGRPNNDCCKEVLRILKAWCYRHKEMRPLTSYHLKTVLLHEVRAERDWGPYKVSLRVNGCFYRLYLALLFRNLPHYFDRRINLLHRMQTTKAKTIKVINNMKDRLHGVLHSSDSYGGAFNAIQLQVMIFKALGAWWIEDRSRDYDYDDGYDEAWTAPTVVPRRSSVPEGLAQWISRNTSPGVIPHVDSATRMVAPTTNIARRLSAPDVLMLDTK